MVNPLTRAINSFKYRVLGITAPKFVAVDTRTEWERKRDEHCEEVVRQGGDWRYFRMLEQHVASGPHPWRIFPLFGLPLLNQSRRIVELGSSFSFFPETYTSPFGVSSNDMEGVVSTRVFLTACRLLERMGVDATVTSVDIRDVGLYENAVNLLTEMGLIKYWRPVMGTDSVAWLKSQTELIDLCLVDSNHTYEHVSNELEHVRPLMSERGIIIVDNCYDLDYRPHASWNIDETEGGATRGGEFGAVLEFVEKYPEYHVEWEESWVHSVAYLFRR